VCVRVWVCECVRPCVRAYVCASVYVYINTKLMCYCTDHDNSHYNHKSRGFENHPNKVNIMFV